MTESPPTLGVRIFVALLIAGLSYACWASIRYGLSDIYFFQAQAYFDSWRESKDPIDLHEWETATNALESALRLEPRYPAYLELLGDMNMLKSGEVELTDLARAEFQTTGIDYYRQAILRRPSWPFGWAKFALLKNQSNEVDEDLTLALNRALLLGPHEPVVHLVAAQIALTSWESLDEALRPKLLDSIALIAQSSPERIMKMAIENEMMSDICPRVGTVQGWEVLCEDPEEPLVVPEE